MICSVVLSIYLFGQVSALVVIMYWQKVTGNSLTKLPMDVRIKVMLAMMVASFFSWVTVWLVFGEDV